MRGGYTLRPFTPSHPWILGPTVDDMTTLHHYSVRRGQNNKSFKIMSLIHCFRIKNKNWVFFIDTKKENVVLLQSLEIMQNKDKALDESSGKLGQKD